MARQESQNRGITLIELVIVIAIVALLSAIAIPNYSHFQKKSLRAEAKTALNKIQTQQERFYVSNFTYTDDLAALGFNGDRSDNGLYILSVPTANEDGFQAIATAAADERQADDADCQQFSINNLTERDASPDPDGDCW